MSFLDKIEKIQKKPEHVRYKILFISVAVIMFAIIFVWVSVVKLSFEPKIEKKESVVSPINSAFGFIKDISGTIKDGVEEINKQLRQLK